jgi:trk system potassium uptake protein TrkH
MRQVAVPAHLLQKAERGLLRLTPPQALALSFVGLSLLGTLLLKIPAASSRPTSWLQALFTAVSASTVTGLTVVDTGNHFTLFGHWVILFLIQAGGLGLMTFGVFFIHLNRGQLALSHRAALRETLNQSGPGDLRRILRWALGFTVFMELAGTALLALHWIPQMGWSRGLFVSFFHAVSAFNNAGMGLAANSLTDHVAHPLLNLVICFLFISGGIGFVVVADIIEKKRFRKYALHTKLMLVGTLAINVIAMLVLLVLEYGNPKTLGPLSWDGKLWAAWFQGVTPRSVGFNTIDIAAMLPSSVFFIMGLMFIGGGSGSTAGGIKLSTFLVMLLATRALLRQEDHPVVFGRSIQLDTVRKALAITVISLFCVVTGVFLLTVTDGKAFLDLSFEGVSAFGTVGLSRGITPNLTAAGQGVVIALMLIGRVGPLTLAFTLSNPRKTRIQYAPAQVSVG